jgi:hypothetical protein
MNSERSVGAGLAITAAAVVLIIATVLAVGVIVHQLWP